MKKSYDWKLNKAKNTMDKINKLKTKQKLPLCLLQSLDSMLNNILLNNQDMTIQKDVMEFYKKENYTIKQDGIGWIISW